MRKHIIYLAAGSGRRFGGNKLLSECGGKPLYRHGLELLVSLAARDDVTLTVVSRYAEILAAARANGARAVIGRESEKGLAYSIREGLDALGQLPPADFIVFAVADQPRLSRATVERLLAAAAPGVQTAAVSYGGRRGSPTMFSAALVPELYTLTGEQGGREVIGRHACLLVPADSATELCDIDTPAEISLFE